MSNVQEKMMKKLLLLMVVLSSFSVFAADDEGKYYVDTVSSRIQGYKIVLEGKAATKLVELLEETGSETVKCAPEGRKDYCIIRINPQTGEVMDTPRTPEFMD